MPLVIHAARDGALIAPPVPELRILAGKGTMLGVTEKRTGMLKEGGSLLRGIVDGSAEGSLVSPAQNCAAVNRRPSCGVVTVLGI